MCGIFAFIKNTSQFSIPSDLVQQLLYGWGCGKGRGPENSIMKYYDYGMLGFHRLAINGLDDISNQPLEKDDCVLICNGEIYTYTELYAQLEVVPKTHSDCERSNSVISHSLSSMSLNLAVSLNTPAICFLDRAEFAVVDNAAVERLIR